MHQRVFSLLRDKLGEEVRRAAVLRECRQRYRAFKYLTRAEEAEEEQAEVEEVGESEEELVPTPRDRIHRQREGLGRQ